MKITMLLFFSSLLIGVMLKSPNNSFTESDITLDTPTGKIEGSLVVPSEGKTFPLAIMIAGSGATDRNCNAPGLQTNAYKMLAEDLAKSGIATLRFDKRGVAKSVSAMTSEVDLRFEHYVDDVSAWVTKMREDSRFSKIILIGHSEGSLIGLVAANKINVDGLISIAGAGKPADEILKSQLQNQLPPALIEESNTILASLKKGETVKKPNPSLAALYRPSVQPYLISWFKYNPQVEIKKLKAPILIVQGTTDLQVKVEDAELLAEANPKAEKVIFEEMNHILKESVADPQLNVATYNQPELALKEGFSKSIAEFILN